MSTVIVAPDGDRRRLVVELDEVRATAKRLSKSQRGKPSEEDWSSPARSVREDERRLSAELESTGGEPGGCCRRTYHAGPEGAHRRQDAYTVLRHVGDPPGFDFEPKPHDELGLRLGMFDWSMP